MAVIDFDEESLAALGQWPWPRSYLAKLVRNATRMNAIVIGFDVIFAEQDRLSPANIAQNVENLDPVLQRQLATMPSFDTLFARQMKKSRVVLGMTVVPSGEGHGADSMKRVAGFGFKGPKPYPYIGNFDGVIGSVEELDAASAGRGLLSLTPDFDGIVRRVPLAYRVGKKIIPTLALEMLRVATGRNITIQTGKSGIEGFILAKTLVPTDSSGQIWVKYSPFDEASYIPAVDVIDGTVDPKRLAGKIILFGTSAAGLKDLRSSPLQASLPGVEMHLQVLENILTQSYLFRPDWVIALEWLGTLLTGLTLIIVVPIVGARATMAMLILVSAVAVGTSFYGFLQYSHLIDVSYTLGVAFLTYVTLVYANYLSTEKERTRIRNAFAHYLSPDLVQRLSSSPDSLVLGGEQKEMTFLFCDIRGFTSISESFKSDPQGLTNLINRFLTPMTDQILVNSGTIDKYMGDSIMAFWNAPLDNENHPRDAADASLNMMDRLDELNADLEREALEEDKKFMPIKIGIGLNTGDCIVGNLGSAQRFDYSVLGDPVNLASRLEGQSKEYGFNIIIGESTAEAISDYALIELDLIAVKGKEEAVRIFGLAGPPEFTSDAEFISTRSDIGELLSHYKKQDWDNAEKSATKVRDRGPVGLKIFGQLYLNRIQEFRENPVSDDWDGVFRATSK